ncbi:MAG: DUF4864 domain-containing protein [Rhizobiaceae bacterium]|nr:DUF4864 domain-containing protein [Rhizobiaceae bacterium]
MPKWLKITLGVVAAVIAVIVAIVYIAIWATSGLVEPVERQLAAMKAGNMEAAYAETSEAFQQATPMDAFIAFVDQNPILKDTASHSFTNRSINNGIGVLEGQLTSSTGGVVPVAYQLVKENGVWKIQHIQLNPAGAS